MGLLCCFFLLLLLFFVGLAARLDLVVPGFCSAYLSRLPHYQARVHAVHARQLFFFFEGRSPPHHNIISSVSQRQASPTSQQAQQPTLASPALVRTLSLQTEPCFACLQAFFCAHLQEIGPLRTGATLLLPVASSPRRQVPSFTA